MSAADELAALYEQWRNLTEDEGRSVEAGDWSEVENFQSAKRRLQPRISEVSQRLDAETHERQFRPVVEGLMELERCNSTTLLRKRRAAERQRLELDQASRNLRQLHKSYVPPSRTHWQSYS